MSSLKSQRLQKVLYACLRIRKSEADTFSSKWLRLAGTPVSDATLRQLCAAGCLELSTGERGTRWYKVVRSTVPFERRP
jgi:hypothetical protein